MYERNAIVLERYFEKIFGFTKESNLKTTFENYIKIIETIQEYKRTTDEEEVAIAKFDEAAKEIEDLQKREAKLHEANIELENQRNKLFNDFSENPNTLDSKLNKIEEKLESNNEDLKEIRVRYVKAIALFIERQKERNNYARVRRTAESNFRNQISFSIKTFEKLDNEDITKIQEFIHMENDKLQEDILSVLIKNGKNERVPFYNKVLENATRERIKIAKIEADLYFNIYDKTRRILKEIENESIKLVKAEKISRDTEIKLAFLGAEKEYIVAFLDNERMTVINGKKTHERLMEEACKNFDKDIQQIGNLYELILRETMNKSTKKAYKELYNKDYLRRIEEKEKDFEEEVTNVKINIGTVINSNYWRIEGIKNIYKVFQEEVSEKFDKDLSELKIEEPEEIIQESVFENYKEKEEETYNNIYIDDEDDEDEDESYDFDEEDEYDEDDDEYEEDDDEENKYNNEEEYSNEDDDDEDDYDEYEEEDDDEDDYDEYEEEDDLDEYEDEEENDYYDEDEADEYDTFEEDDGEVIIESKEDDDDLTEEKIDEIIRNSRKNRKKKTTEKSNKKTKKSQEEENTKGLFGKLFKK